MSATERLRELLDERGVEYGFVHGYKIFHWDYDSANGIGSVSATEVDGGINILACGLTPEQAIAATLGDADATDARQGDAGTCHDVGGCRWFRCSACGFGIEDMYVSDEDEYPPEDQPRYCPNCGRLVVEVDK